MINLLAIYYSFIVISIMTVVGFVGASTIPQLISAVLFFPLAAYFWLLVFPKRTKPVPSELILEVPSVNLKKKARKEEAINLKKVPPRKSGYDIDRRMFLKLIGSAGLSIFFLSIFTKKAEAAFFGSVPGPGTVAIKDTTGVQIDPAIKSPTDGYKISQIDDSTPSYYGFVNKGGLWFIMKEDTSSGNYRYTKGTTGFSTNWTNRASLTYDYFNVVFG